MGFLDSDSTVVATTDELDPREERHAFIRAVLNERTAANLNAGEVTRFLPKAAHALAHTSVDLLQELAKKEIDQWSLTAEFEYGTYTTKKNPTCDVIFGTIIIKGAGAVANPMLGAQDLDVKAKTLIRLAKKYLKEDLGAPWGTANFRRTPERRELEIWIPKHSVMFEFARYTASALRASVFIWCPTKLPSRYKGSHHAAANHLGKMLRGQFGELNTKIKAL
jgi:hypothetical protein